MTEVDRKLDTLAEKINKEHRRVESAVGSALEHARRAGKLLVEAKERTTHGKWLPWLAENFEGSDRVAQMYMRVHARWAEIEANTKSVSNLTLSGALQSIGPPKTEVTQERVEGELTWAHRPDDKITSHPPKTEKFLGRVTDAASSEPEAEPVREDGEKSILEMYAERGELPGEAVPVSIERVRNAELTVKFSTGRSEPVSRSYLLSLPEWKKCDCCGGYGIVKK